MSENLDLFDDYAEIIPASSFKDSEEDTKQKGIKDDKSSKNDDPITTINPLEGLEYDDEDKNKQDDKSDEVEDTDQEEVELTDEEKELVQKVQDLKNIGALYLPDDYEVESIEKAIEDSDNYRTLQATKEVFSKIPDVEVPGIGNAKDLFLYLFEHGGDNIDSFKKNFGTESFDPKSYDLSKEDDRRKILEQYYQKKGFNEVKTKKIVDKLFDDLEDETEATEALGELTKLDAQEKQAHLKELENKRIQAQKDAQEAFNLMQSILEKNDVVGGYPIGKNEKTKALNSLYAQVNTENGPTSHFNYTLNSVVLNDAELTLALSAFLNTLSQDKNKKLYFDLSKFQKEEKSKAVKNLKETTSRLAAGRKPLSSTPESVNPANKGFSWNNVIDYSEL